MPSLSLQLKVEVPYLDSVLKVKNQPECIERHKGLHLDSGRCLKTDGYERAILC